MQLLSAEDFIITHDVNVLLSGDADDHITHVFCHTGRIQFRMNGKQLEATAHNYVIFIDPALADEFTPSHDLNVTIILLSKDSPASSLADNGFNVVAMPFLLLDPVIPLSEDDRKLCLEDISMLHRRVLLTNHHVYRNMVQSLLEVHIYNLHDMIMRRLEQQHLSARAERLMAGFVNMLRRGDYREHRDLHHYASQLAVADNYLTQVSRQVSTHPATYWINLFTASEINQLLKDGTLTLTDIADRFNFSSMSYFSRYVTRELGKTPTELRRQ